METNEDKDPGAGRGEDDDTDMEKDHNEDSDSDKDQNPGAGRVEDDDTDMEGDNNEDPDTEEDSEKDSDTSVDEERDIGRNEDGDSDAEGDMGKGSDAESEENEHLGTEAVVPGASTSLRAPPRKAENVKLPPERHSTRIANQAHLQYPPTSAPPRSAPKPLKRASKAKTSNLALKLAVKAQTRLGVKKDIQIIDLTLDEVHFRSNLMIELTLLLPSFPSPPSQSDP